MYEEIYPPIRGLMGFYDVRISFLRNFGVLQRDQNHYLAGLMLGGPPPPLTAICQDGSDTPLDTPPPHGSQIWPWRAFSSKLHQTFAYDSGFITPSSMKSSYSWNQRGSFSLKLKQPFGLTEFPVLCILYWSSRSIGSFCRVCLSFYHSGNWRPRIALLNKTNKWWASSSCEV